MKLMIRHRAMHTTLLAVTSQSLAFESLKRLDQFPRDLMDPEIMKRAVQRTHEADAELNEGMIELHTSFKEVMRLAIPSPSSPSLSGGETGSGRRRGSLSLKLEDRARTDRDRDVDRRIREKVDYDDLAAVRKRVIELERRLEDSTSAPPSESRTRIEAPDYKGKGRAMEPSPPPGHPPLPPPPEDPSFPQARSQDTAEEQEQNQDGVEVKEPGKAGKRSRARALLDDMLIRLEKVESLKGSLEDRYSTLEDLVNSRDQDELEIRRMGNVRWKIIEELRDPDGVIRGVDRPGKRKREQERQESRESSLIAEREDGVEDVPTAGIMTGGTEVDTSAYEVQPTSVEEAKDLSISTIPMAEGAKMSEGSESIIKELKNQVDSLRRELKDMKGGQADREKEIIARVTSALREDMRNSVQAVSYPSHPLAMFFVPLYRQKGLDEK